MLEASVQYGVAHTHACGGWARCTTCRVEVLEGAENCPAMSDQEREVLGMAGFGGNIRLACQLIPTGDIKVRLLVRDRTGREFLLPEGMAREREVAVLFSDIRGFTKFAETHLAFDVLHLLNRYFDRMGTIVELQKGEVVAFLGDGLVCLYEDVNHRRGATNATRSALKMVEAATSFSDYSRDHFGFDMQLGVGVAWGPAVIGEVGYYRKSHLNCIGDVVNTAARVQEATKEFGAPALITEGIRQLVEDRFEFGRVFDCSLRGKEARHTLYEVLREK